MSTRPYVAGQEVVRDEARQRQDVGEGRPVAEGREVRLERHAGPAHRVAALAADRDDRDVTRVSMMSRATKRTMFVLSGPDSGGPS